MTTPHRATPEQWADAGAFASDTRACLLELRDRIAALEAAATPPPAPDHFRGVTEMVATAEAAPPPAPAGGLVERVAEAYGFSSWKDKARAAIHAVAAWLDTRGQHGCSLWLREEADR